MNTINLTEDMFSTGKPIAQGEVLIWMKKYAPIAVLERLAKLSNVTEMDSTGQYFILGHSETGHHHVLEPVDSIPLSQAAQVLIDSINDTLVELKLLSECRIRHLRQHDTHDAYILPPGEYVRGIREEQSIDGWRRVAD